MFDPYTFIVICRDDVKPDGDKGDYTLATRRVFHTRAEASAWAAGVSPSREAIVVDGRWHQLRIE